MLSAWTPLSPQTKAKFSLIYFIYTCIFQLTFLRILTLKCSVFSVSNFFLAIVPEGWPYFDLLFAISILYGSNPIGQLMLKLFVEMWFFRKFQKFCSVQKNRKAHIFRKFQSISGNFDHTESHLCVCVLFVCSIYKENYSLTRETILNLVRFELILCILIYW